MTKRGNRATDKEKRRCTGESTRAVYIATATVCQYNTVDARSGAGDGPGGGGGCEGGGGGGGLVVVRCLRCYDTILREISHLQEKTIIPDSTVRAPRLALGSSRRHRDVSLPEAKGAPRTYIYTHNPCSFSRFFFPVRPSESPKSPTEIPIVRDRVVVSTASSSVLATEFSRRPLVTDKCFKRSTLAFPTHSYPFAALSRIECTIVITYTRISLYTCLLMYT